MITETVTVLESERAVFHDSNSYFLFQLVNQLLHIIIYLSSVVMVV